LLDAIPWGRCATSQSLAVAAGLAHPEVLSRLDELASLGLVVAVADRWRLSSPPSRVDLHRN
jgi:hypothetical protein